MTAKPKRKHTPNEERRRTSIEGVMQAARRLFVTQGYEATSIDQIARQVGLTKGAVYFYFKDKAALLLALLDESERELFDPIFERIHGAKGSATDKLVMFINWIAGYGSEHEELLLLPVLVSLEFNGRDQPAEARVRQLYQRVHDELTEVLGEGQRRGEFDDSVPAGAQADVIIGITDGMLLQWYRWETQLEGRVLARTARSVILNGLIRSAD